MKKTVVHVIESDRGWGTKIYEVKDFDTRNDAEAFVKKFNKRNNKTKVPDWYMYATIVEQ